MKPHNHDMERLRQQSLQAWAEANRRALHEAVRNTPVNPAQAAGASGSGSGGAISGGAFNLSNTLSAFNARHAEITSLVPAPGVINFFDDSGASSNTNRIEDGYSDMYDGGNYFNTNLTQIWDDITTDDADTALNIPYTHTQQIGDANDFSTGVFYDNPPQDGVVAGGASYFGAGSQYFTNMYPGLFLLMADNVDITEFSIGGDIGTDGSNVVDAVSVDPVPGHDWTVFLKTNSAQVQSDPCINHLILIPGGSEGITQLYDNQGRWDDHGLFGLSGRKTVICAVLGTQHNQPLTSSDAVTLATKILDIATSA